MIREEEEWQETWEAAVDLLGIVQGYDNRAISDSAIEAWAVSMAAGKWPMNLAREAVATHYSHTDKWIMPAHVNAYIRNRRDADQERQAQLARRNHRRELAPPTSTQQARKAAVRHIAETFGRLPPGVTTEERADVLSVRCGYCGAEQWRACTAHTSKGDRETNPHPSRYDAMYANQEGGV